MHRKVRAGSTPASATLSAKDLRRLAAASLPTPQPDMYLRGGRKTDSRPATSFTAESQDAGRSNRDVIFRPPLSAAGPIGRVQSWRTRSPALSASHKRVSKKPSNTSDTCSSASGPMFTNDQLAQVAKIAYPLVAALVAPSLNCPATDEGHPCGVEGAGAGLRARGYAWVSLWVSVSGWVHNAEAPTGRPDVSPGWSGGRSERRATLGGHSTRHSTHIGNPAGVARNVRPIPDIAPNNSLSSYFNKAGARVRPQINRPLAAQCQPKTIGEQPRGREPRPTRRQLGQLPAEWPLGEPQHEYSVQSQHQQRLPRAPQFRGWDEFPA